MNKAKSITSLPSNLLTFIKEAREELKKVQWPSRETTIRYTIIVIISSIVVGIVTGGLDYILAIILEKYIL